MVCAAGVFAAGAGNICTAAADDTKGVKRRVAPALARLLGDQNSPRGNICAVLCIRALLIHISTAISEALPFAISAIRA